jgi:hypothetical protein
MRYKIPLMPYYIVGIILIIDYAKRLRKEEQFDKGHDG